jgi:alpha-L-arabinofuranosidase
MRRSRVTSVTVTVLLVASAGRVAAASSLARAREGEPAITKIEVDVHTVLSDVSHHPIGINLDYLMDDDAWLKPVRSTSTALRAMGVRYLRYPGGEKSDLTLWSTPPFEASRPTLARTGESAVRDWGKMIEDFSRFKHEVLDFDEFMEMARALRAEPVVVVAADSYLADHPPGTTVTDRGTLLRTAVEWVRYANLEKGYGVRYWMIGNESWHKDNVGSSPEIYARDVVDFSRAMKAVDPGIRIIANGNTREWWEVVLPMVASDIDAVCISNYPMYDYKAGYATYRDAEKDLVGPTRTAIEATRSLPRPADRGPLKVIVAEYNTMDWAGSWPSRNDMAHALALFDMTGELLKLPEVAFSLFWNTRWIENDAKEDSIDDALDRNGAFNAAGQVLAIWGNFLAPRMVRTTSSVRVRSFASHDPRTGLLYVYLVNKSEEVAATRLDLGRSSLASIVERWELLGRGPLDTEPVWRRSESLSSRAGPLELVLPGTSIAVIQIELERRSSASGRGDDR